MKTINEIGEGVTPYKFSIGEETQHGMEYNFTTEGGDDYLVQFTILGYDGIDGWDVSFYSRSKETDFMSDDETNKGEQFKIISTVMAVIGDFLKENPNCKRISFVSKDKDGQKTNQRDLLYRAYIQKNIHKFNGWDFKIEDDKNVMFKKPPINEMSPFTYEIIKELLEPTYTSIFAASSKPPTLGHFTVVKNSIEQTPNLDKYIIFVGSGIRDGVTQEESMKIWEIYKKYLTPKLQILPTTSPVSATYEYIKNHPEEKIQWVLGAREEKPDDLIDIQKRVKSISPEKHPHVTTKIINITGGISGTLARQSLIKRDKEEFLKLIPKIKERDEIWDILTQPKAIIQEYSNQDTLNPIIWNGETIKPKLREALIKIAYKFYNDLDTDLGLENIVLLGSSANYNWTEHSDIDLHLLIPFQQEENSELLKKYFDAKKIDFNNKYDLEYLGHQIEVYVQDPNEQNAAEGIYSLTEDEWLLKPEKQNINVSDEKIDNKTQPFIDQINNLTPESDPSEIAKLKLKINQLRKSGLESKGEYSVENLAFKRLRNEGYLEKLSQLQQDSNVNQFEIPLNEGAYDSLTNQVSSDIFSFIKSSFPTKKKKLNYFKEYKTTDAKGRKMEFDCFAEIQVIKDQQDLLRTGGEAYGGDDEDSAYIKIVIEMSPDIIPSYLEIISFELKDVVRHELEHLSQDGNNLVQDKLKTINLKLYNKLKDNPNDNKIDKKYHKLDNEVDAFLQGMYLKAKKTKTPFKDIIATYFDTTSLSQKQIDSVLKKWEKRLPALNLPPIRESQEQIPGGLSSGKDIEDIAKHHDISLEDIESQLNKGIKVELEHTTSQEIAKEIAMDHLWEDPKYYDKLSQIENRDINESENDLNVQDLIYKQDPQILKDGIKKELIFIKTLLPQTAKYAGKENREKFWDFIKSLKGKIKRVPLNSVFPTQSGDDYKNASSEAEAEEFEKVINGELSVNDVRKQNYYPLLINSTNDKIIDGHHRHYALTKINSPYAVCLFVDIPNEYLDEMYGNHEQMLIDRKKTVNESIDYGKALKAMAARKDPDKITDFGKEQLQEMDSNEIEYWANHYDIFKSLSSNISNFDKLKPKLKGKQLEALMYFYELINTENIQENEVPNQPQYQEYIDKVMDYCCDELNIPQPTLEIVDETYTKENHSFGGYSPQDNKIYLMLKGRKLRDGIFTLSHELRHSYQKHNNLLNSESGDDGSPEENDAHSYAGVVCRRFGRKYPEIFEITC